MYRGKINRAGLALIQHFESLKLAAYQDSAGVWTIDWGHTGLAYGGGEFLPGQVSTAEQAEKLLIMDLQVFEIVVQTLVKVKLNRNQFPELVSFAFNLGKANCDNPRYSKS